MDDGNLACLNDKPELDLNTNIQFEGYWENLALETSQYFTEDQFISKHSNRNTNTFLSLNIQSLPSKFLEFTNIIDRFRKCKVEPAAISIQETWATSGGLDLFGIKGYSLFGKSRENRQGGGVCIYARNDLKPELLSEYSKFHEGIYESCVVRINVSKFKKIILMSIYRPNNHPVLTREQQLDQFHRFFSQHIDEVKKIKVPIYIFMDSNIDLLKSGMDVNSNIFVATCAEKGLYFLNNKATRLTGNLGTLIDQIITNDSTDKIYCTGTICESPSDHLINFTSLKNMQTKASSLGFTFKRKINEESTARFHEGLQNLSWDDVTALNCPNASAQKFNETFFELFEMHFPKVRIKVNRHKVPLNNWMTHGLLKSRKRKLMLDRKAKKCPTPTNIEKFKTYRNVYNACLKRAKKLYFKHKLTNANGNSKMLWSVINEIKNKPKSKDSIDEIKVNDQILTDELEIANAFNVHFTNIGENIKKLVPTTDVDFKTFLPPSPPHSFFIRPILPQDIIEAARRLKGKLSTDSNNLSTKLLKDVINGISKPLAHIFNISAASGCFPDCFKTSKTICIFKQGDRTDMNNYRGISLVNAFSKLLERVFADQLMKYLLRNDFFYQGQFGFLKGRNTKQAALQIINYITEALNNGEYCIGIFLDIMKAFDSVNWDILFSKLEHYGIRGTALEFVKSYFLNRTQNVQIGNTISNNNCKITCSVLQGTIIGVIFFVIFINDLPNASNFFKIFLFADDGSNMAKDSNLQDLISKSNFELNKIVQWYACNGLAIHPSKSRLMIFRPKHLALDTEPFTQIFINLNAPNEFNITKVRPIRPVPNEDEKYVKLLGYYLDNKLSMGPHIESLKGKLNGTNYCLRMASEYLDTEHLKLLYFAHFHSHLVYSAIFLNMANDGYVQQLQVLQNKAVRIVFKQHSRENAHNLIKSMQSFTVNQLTTFEILRFMFDLRNNRLPSIFNSTWIQNGQLRANLNYQLRNDADYFEPGPKFMAFLKLPLLNFPRIWNNIPAPLKLLTSRGVFTSRIMDYVCS